uniref:uncharacterized protein C7orf26 homolog isoform X2 n=1 Tax=Styela clava TaxID=7725 RepID=UPI00193AA0E5|nr:uncharacterized protein C7orf26 homolog isoform X2 [Styela clava]
MDAETIHCESLSPPCVNRCFSCQKSESSTMSTQMNQRNFNSTVQETLKRLDIFFVSQSTLAASNMYADKDALIAHVDQVLFTPKETKKSKNSHLNELDLANEICTFCSRQKTEYVRYCVFDTLFSMTRSTAKDYRRQILVISTSLAIALKLSAVLECAALWLATTTKEHAIYVASQLEEDFCSVMPESSSEVKLCNTICEKFCCMLMTVYCTKYTMKDPSNDVNKVVSYPSQILLDIIQHWVSQNPKICFCVIQKVDQLWHTVLTTTRTAKNSISLSPLAGLIQWCAKLPFAPEIETEQRSTFVKEEYTKLQSRLHFGVLTAILSSQDCLKVMQQGVLGKESDFQLWGKSDAHLLVGSLLAYGADSPDPKNITLSIDRFSQISQIAMTSHILTITKEQFQSLTDPLPKTKLLEIVAYGPERKPSIDDVHMS